MSKNNLYVYVVLKEKSTTHYITTQQISVVGDIPAKVKNDDYVRTLLKNGTCVEVSEKEYEAKMAEKKTQEQKEKEALAKKAESSKKLFNESFVKAKKFYENGSYGVAKAYLDVCEVHSPGNKETADLLKKVEKGSKETAEEAEKAEKAKSAKEAAEKAEAKDLLEKAMKAGKIEKKNDGYYFGNKNIGDKESAVIDNLLKDEKLVDAVEKSLLPDNGDGNKSAK